MNQVPKETRVRRLSQLDGPFKALVTMFTIVLSCGFGVAHLYLHHTVDRADGKEDLVPTARDIALHYHGEPGTTRFRNKVLGSMKKYFSAEEDPGKLTPEEEADHAAVLDWDMRGAPEAEYWNPATKDYAKIGNILLNRGCFDCHAPDAVGKGSKPKSPLDTYAGVKKFATENTGMSTGELLMLSHIHLLGMGLMFLGLGFAVALTSFSARLRAGVICAGFASVLLDIGGWWAVKFGGANWTGLVLAGGLLMGAAFALGALMALHECWLRKPPPEA